MRLTILKGDFNAANLLIGRIGSTKAEYIAFVYHLIAGIPVSVETSHEVEHSEKPLTTRIYRTITLQLQIQLAIAKLR